MDPSSSSCASKSHTLRAWLSSALFILGCTGLHCCSDVFSSCSAWASHCGGFSCHRAQAQSLQRRDLVAPRYVGCSRIRDHTHVSCIEQVDSSPLSHQGSPPLPEFRAGVRPSEDVCTHCHLGKPNQRRERTRGALSQGPLSRRADAQHWVRMGGWEDPRHAGHVSGPMCRTAQPLSQQACKVE